MSNGVIRSRVHYQESDGVLTHITDQPSEKLILQRNQRLRNNPGVMNDLGRNSEGGSWGRMVASIPFIIYERAKRDGYQLNAPDKEMRSKELFRFLQSDMGKTCLIREKL